MTPGRPHPGPADVIVVGAGLAGLMAGNCAAAHGVRVLVLERGRDAIYPCNTRYSGGLFHIAMDDLAGDADRVWANVRRALGPGLDVPLAGALIQGAPRAIRVLKALGVRFIVAGPDGLRRHSLAPPIIRKAGLHWRGRAGDVMLRTLEGALRQRGGHVVRAATATELIMQHDPRRCVGVRATIDSVPIDLIATSVILADGGFQSDPELLGEHVTSAPLSLLQRNARAGIGSGLRMAANVGARLSDDLRSFYGHVQHRSALDHPNLWPYPVLDTLATAAVVIDAGGRRFCDEGGGGVHIANCIARSPDPLSTSIVFDQAIWQGPGREGLLPVNPGIVAAGGEILSADSIEGLARELRVPNEVLRETIDLHNRSVSNGPSAGSAAEQVPRTTGRHKAWPIRHAPFHAFRVCAGITYTMGGILTDAQARVLGSDSTPILGLFAAGATTGGLEGTGFSGYTGGLSKAATFGMLAGEGAGRLHRSAAG